MVYILVYIGIDKGRTVVLEKTLESPLDSSDKTVNPKGNQP